MVLLHNTVLITEYANVVFPIYLSLYQPVVFVILPEDNSLWLPLVFMQRILYKKNLQEEISYSSSIYSYLVVYKLEYI